MDELYTQKNRARQALAQAQADYDNACHQELEAWKVYATRIKSEKMKEQL